MFCSKCPPPASTQAFSRYEMSNGFVDRSNKRCSHNVWIYILFVNYTLPMIDVSADNTLNEL